MNALVKHKYIDLGLGGGNDGNDGKRKDKHNKPDVDSDVQIEDIEEDDVPSKFSIYENRKAQHSRHMNDFPPVLRESEWNKKKAHSDDEYSASAGSNQESVNEAISIPPDFVNLHQRMGTDGEIEID